MKADAGVAEAKALNGHVHWIQVPAFRAHLSVSWQRIARNPFVGTGEAKMH